MINRILEFSLRQRMFILMATAILIALGLWSAVRLPMDAVPDITNVQVQINTSVEALAAEEIEKLITFPIENAMAGLQGLEQTRSISRFGLSQVTLVFADGADIYRARQMVTERLQSALGELPSTAGEAARAQLVRQRVELAAAREHRSSSERHHRGPQRFREAFEIAIESGRFVHGKRRARRGPRLPLALLQESA